jgi:hypothetical protein
MPFQNFLAAARKPNLKRFKLFPSDLNLDWIDGAQSGTPEVFTHPTTLTGTMNGVNATFLLDSVTATPSLTRLVWNGITLQEDVGFAVSGGTITMKAGYIPVSGDKLEAEVWV